MSFTVNFTVHDDGAIELTGASAEVPPGFYTVSGHKHNGEDGNYAYNSIGISGPYASASGGAQVPAKESA